MRLTRSLKMKHKLNHKRGNMENLNNKNEVIISESDLFDSKNGVDRQMKKLALSYDLKIWVENNCPLLNDLMNFSSDECHNLMEQHEENYFAILELFESLERAIAKEGVKNYDTINTDKIEGLVIKLEKYGKRSNEEITDYRRLRKEWKIFMSYRDKAKQAYSTFRIHMFTY
jgi:hypothetical protein